MEIIYALCAFVWAILSIILFFKVWGMTNKVSDLYNLLQSKDDNTDLLYTINRNLKCVVDELKKLSNEQFPTSNTGYNNLESNIVCDKIPVGELVIRISDNELMIIEESLADNKYRCSLKRDNRMQSIYSIKEIKQSK